MTTEGAEFATNVQFVVANIQFTGDNIAQIQAFCAAWIDSNGRTTEIITDAGDSDGQLTIGDPDIKLRLPGRPPTFDITVSVGSWILVGGLQQRVEHRAVSVKTNAVYERDYRKVTGSV